MMRVDGIEVREADDGAVVSGTVHEIPGRGRPVDLWFRFAGLSARCLTATGDPFLAGLLPIAVWHPGPLQIDNEVSERLIHGAQQMVAIWRRWERGVRRLEIRAPAVRRMGRRAAGVGCFFTGGIDSFYTVLKNLEFEAGHAPITHLIFIRGYDEMPLENEPLYHQVVERLSGVARALGVGLVLVSTNLGELFQRANVRWDMSAGAALAAPGLCLPRLVRRALIPAGDTYSTLSPWGSHPLTDPLWSTELLEFVHDGCEASRAQKIDRFIRSSDLALQHLRVCGYGLGDAYNCGRCEKCLRTMIGLHAYGALDRCATLPHRVPGRLVSRLNASDPVVRFYVRDNLAALHATGADPELASVLRRLLQPHPLRWFRTRLERWGREVDQRLLNGRVRQVILARARDARLRSELKSNPLRALVSRPAWRRQRPGARRADSDGGAP
jgi:hypothetical protein